MENRRSLSELEIAAKIKSLEGLITRYEGDDYRDMYNNIRCPYNEIVEDCKEKIGYLQNNRPIIVYNVVEQGGYLAGIKFISGSFAQCEAPKPANWLWQFYKDANGLGHLSNQEAVDTEVKRLLEIYRRGDMIGEVAVEFEKYKQGGATVVQGDSELLLRERPNGSLHIMTIDPPYAGDVNYAELSEFFLAWDKNMLPKIFPNWSTESVRKQAVEFDFEAKMAAILKQCYRVLHDDGTLILFFASKHIKVWKQLQLGLGGAGFNLVQFHTITTEPKNAGIRKGKRYNISMVMILKKHDTRNCDWKQIYEDKIAEYEFTDVDKTNLKWCSQIMCGEVLT